jgi:hypothetical protein
MADTGQWALEREVAVLTDILRRPPSVALHKSDAVMVSKGPPLTITYRNVLPDRAMTAALVGVLLVVILFAAREVTASLGFGWPAAIATTGAMLAPLALLARPGNTTIIVDADGLRVRGLNGAVTLARTYIAAIEAHQDLSKGARVKTFHVRVRTTNDALIEIVAPASKEECWFLQDQLERALHISGWPIARAVA